MRIKTTKRLPHNVVERELREKPKALLYYLYSKANLKLDSRCFNICICSYSELLELKLLKTSDNTKNNRKAIRKLLDELQNNAYIYYELNEDNNLVIEVCIIEPKKTIENGFTQMPYSIVNNKDIPLILVPTYLAILRHDYQKGLCNPSMNTLAKYSGCSIRTCHSRVKTLQELQLIQVQKSLGGHKKDTNTFYTSNRHILEDGDFFYKLIDVKNTRYELPKKKVIQKEQDTPSIKNMLKQESILEERSCVGEWK